MAKAEKPENQASTSGSEPQTKDLLPSPGSIQSIPDYIADLCGGMIKLAESAKLDMLAYLLGMARLEAEAMSRRSRSHNRISEPGDPTP